MCSGSAAKFAAVWPSNLLPSCAGDVSAAAAASSPGDDAPRHLPAWRPSMANREAFDLPARSQGFAPAKAGRAVEAAKAKARSAKRFVAS